MNSIKPLSRPSCRAAALVLAVLTAASSLSGCALLIGGAAVGGALVVTDRRTSGAQIDDQGIELKANRRIGELMPDRGHVSVTSYDRIVLLSGEVPNESDRTAVGDAIARLDGVKSVVNEIAVTFNTSLATRSADSIITGKVKATFVDAKDLQSNSIKVVTQRGIVYLMGIVSEREAARAADLAAGVPGVQKVVRVFEVVSDEQLANGAAKAP